MTGNGPCRRWLVSDLDGTLVGPDLSIAEHDSAAVARFRAQGGTFIIATGRNEEATGRYHRELGLDTPMILYNGARIVAPDGTRCLDLDLTDVWDVLHRDVLPGLPAGVGAVAFVEGTGYVVKDAASLADYARRDGIRLPAAPAGPPGSVTKLMLIAEVAADLGPIEAELRAHLDEVNLVRSESTYLEVLPLGAGKGAALRRLAERRGMDLSQVAAIGDNLNDAGLLATAGLGVAVGDGHPELRRAADLVVADYAAGAVAHLVDRLLDPDGGKEAGAWEPGRNSAV